MFELPGQPVCCQPFASCVSCIVLHIQSFVLLLARNFSPLFSPHFSDLSWLILSLHFPIFRSPPIPLPLPLFSCAISKCGPLLQYSMVGMHCGRACDNILQAFAHTQHTYFPSQIFCDSLISLFVRIVFCSFYFHLFFSSRHAMLRYATFGVFR